VSAVLRPVPGVEPMREGDLRAVLEIEEGIYEFPWTLGNFRDSLRAGYACLVMREGKNLIGYAVLMLAAGEAHLLNLSIAVHWQRRGHGRGLLDNVVQVVREHKARFVSRGPPDQRSGPAPVHRLRLQADRRAAAATTPRARGARTRWCWRSNL